MAPDDHYTWMTVAEVAVLFQVSDQTVYRWARRGILPAKRLPGDGGWRFSRRMVEDILEDPKLGESSERS